MKVFAFVLTIWYILGCMCLIPSIIKGYFPWRKHHWKEYWGNDYYKIKSLPAYALIIELIVLTPWISAVISICAPICGLYRKFKNRRI